MHRFLSYGRQSIDEEDIQAVVDVLRSDYLTCGPAVEEFEKEFARFIGAKHAISFANATGALHIAMLAAGIGPGDRVLTSPLTFVASANCAAFVGAIPDFVDVDPATLLFCADEFEKALTPDVKAVIPVDLAGLSPDMPAIAEVARKHGVAVIQDACHAAGGGFEYNGQHWKTGAHPWADMTVFSFHPVKTMTTGEGGMITTDCDELARKARLYRAHGIVRSGNDMQGLGSDLSVMKEMGPWYYEMHELGYNYRLTDIQCALGRSQLKKLNAFMARRRDIVRTYNEAFSGATWIETPYCPADRLQDTSWHLYSPRFDFEGLGMTRTEVMKELARYGVGSQVLYIPVHLQPWYRKTYGYAPGKCPVAERAYAKLISLPLFPAMDDDDVAHVIESVLKLPSL